LREVKLMIYDQYARTCTREQNGRRSAVANPIPGSAAAGDDGDLSRKTRVLSGFRIQITRPR
jgi:hypothetical protein